MWISWLRYKLIMLIYILCGFGDFSHNFYFFFYHLTKHIISIRLAWRMVGIQPKCYDFQANHAEWRIIMLHQENCGGGLERHNQLHGQLLSNVCFLTKDFHLFNSLPKIVMNSLCEIFLFFFFFLRLVYIVKQIWWAPWAEVREIVLCR